MVKKKSTKVYSINEVAEITHRNRVEIWWMVKAKMIKAHRLGKKMWMIPESELKKVKNFRS